MDTILILAGLVVVIALVFDFTNGFHDAANAIANIGGMAMSFLAGAWVPIEWLPDAVARAARLTPGYWADQAISGAYDATSMSASIIRPLLVDSGICALFAVAILSVAMAVGRTRARSSL